MASDINFLPKDFKQRGMYIPFTTPLLAFARLRITADAQTEILVPGLAGNLATYVIPAQELRNVLSLSVYDRSLMDELINLGQKVPNSIRKMASSVSTTGLGGPKLARTARKEREAERATERTIFLILMQKSLDQLGEGAGFELDHTTMHSPEGIMKIRHAFKGFSEAAGIPPEDILDRLGQWDRAVNIIASPDGETLGYYGQLLQNLRDLSQELSSWMAPEPPEIAEMAEFVAVAMRECLKHAEEVYSRILGYSEDMRATMRQWDIYFPQIRNDVMRLTQILDGWSRVVELWGDAQQGDRAYQRQRLEEFAKFVPVLPLDIVSKKSKIWVDLRQSQQRWERESRPDMDEESRAKFNKFKKEVA